MSLDHSKLPNPPNLEQTQDPNAHRPSSQQSIVDRSSQLSQSYLQSPQATEPYRDEVLDCPSDCVAYLQFEAQRRFLRKSPGTTGIAIEFNIEWPGELTKIPAPRFFISDLVSWKSLPDDDDPPEGGYILGMRYDIPQSEGTPMQTESEGGWNYLIYLAPGSPSRQWLRADWAAEEDLVFQESLCSKVSTSQEDPTLGS